ncbi:MAG: sigma-70 family RNA polymerase sigma factor [Prevotella sp.]|uniref:RNA polymerase sigma factor n=1 Tax=Prevotella sp. TaxID=59823 RepID=UPI002A266C34|nr:sigma-70 family RNA polymerase sigma factor [Prevotella sp.]MDD7317537.1 sigma-70 family RNA polymerase sigma factor [Prevotellaceae bacterium]MDY4020616.1 sigma-70 family RNA polymerase sigma factor [Prevotella sp.]
MDKMGDLTLVSRVAVFQDKRAFDALVRKYQSPVRRFFLAQTLGDSQLCDDLAQDTFVKAYTKITSFQGKSSFKTWLFRIAFNVMYDYRRANRITDEIDHCAVSGTASAERDMQLGLDVYSAMSMLKPTERTCVALQLIDGYAIDEIAHIMDMPEGTVKSHLSRGKTKLATYLKQNGYGKR